MYFYKDLYAGSSIEDPDEVKRNLLIGKGQFTIYVITLSPSRPRPGANQLEILHCALLKTPYYRENPPYIIGIANGKNEAVSVVRDLVQEAYDRTGSGDVRAYLFPNGVRVLRGAVQPALPAGAGSAE